MLKKQTKTVLKEIGLILGISILLGVMLSLITHSDKVSNGALSKIDSLTKLNNSLEKTRTGLDSQRTIHIKAIDSLSKVIDSLDGRVKIIKVYYTKKTGEVSKYTPGQLDTFFKIRYNY